MVEDAHAEEGVEACRHVGQLVQLEGQAEHPRMADEVLQKEVLGEVGQVGLDPQGQAGLCSAAIRHKRQLPGWR
jgi:hypothetical protein